MNNGTRRMLLVAMMAAAACMAAAADPVRPLPAATPLRLLVRFNSGFAGQSDPLITTGQSGNGDFLFVKFVDSNTIEFGLDCWGVGGPISMPVKLGSAAVHRLEIEGPMLTEVVGHAIGNAHLRVVFDGAVVLDDHVSFHQREPDRIFFGWNPIGGTSCGQGFHGSLKREDGQPLPGRWSLVAWKIRLAEWWTPESRMILVLLLLATGCVFGFEKLVDSRKSRTQGRPDGAVGKSHPHLWFAGATAVAALAFSFMVTEGNFNFNFPEVFGNFYDYQAAGILHGRLDVPRDVMSGEAFIVHGKTYGYFGPTPALMRIPFVALHLAFGKLSRTFMLLDFVGCLVFSYLILGLMVRMLRGEDAVPSPRSIVLLVSNAGLGSTLFFLGSRAYLHHEAILCGAVFALGSCYYSLRHLAKPAGRAWMAAWAFALLSVNARPTTGLFAFCFLGCAALAVLFRSRAAGAYPARATVRALAIGAACAVGMFSYCLVSYLKFGSFISLPLKDHVQYNPERLARTGGSNFCPSNFAFNVDGYIWTPNIRFWPSFPYMFAAQPNPLDHPEAKMDMVENLLGMPYAMSGLFFLGIGGSVLAMVRRRGLGWVLASVWSAAVPLCMALFTAVAVSQRYTGDFCPLLVVAAAIGLAVYEERRPGAAARTAIVMLTFWSILATLALTFDFGDAVWGVPPEAHARYQRLRSNMNHLLNFHSDAPRP